jgi:predicted DNA-binding transcriptional regulator AlpA
VLSQIVRLAQPDPPADPTPTSPGDGRLLVSARELARLLSVSVATIRRLDAAGKLPRSVRLAGSVRWRLDDIRRFCEAGCPDRAEWERSRERSTDIV